jgi:hypothetical protein
MAAGWKLYSSEQATFLTEEACHVFDSYRPYAVSIGQSYLRCTPREADPKMLNAVLFAGHGSVPQDEEALRAFVTRRIREDFTHGRIAEVQGWLLSQTEARLCALVAIQDENHAA